MTYPRLNLNEEKKACALGELTLGKKSENLNESVLCIQACSKHHCTLGSRFDDTITILLRRIHDVNLFLRRAFPDVEFCYFAGCVGHGGE